MYAVEVFVGRKFGRYARHTQIHRTEAQAIAMIDATERGEAKADATRMMRRVVRA